jgi:thiamine-phosphate pyrophosphorylase
MTLDPFYPIVENADWVRRLLGVGAKLIQLRIKDRPADELRIEIRAALASCRVANAQLIVNDYWDIAIDEGANFVHLGQEDLDSADLKRIRAHGLKLGVSTHDHTELHRGLSFDPDYVALGPIYPTRLKAMAFGPQGLERIGEWKKLIGDRPLVAIGGITLERAPLCLAAGADIVSVVTDITLNADPEARAVAWVKATRSA